VSDFLYPGLLWPRNLFTLSKQRCSGLPRFSSRCRQGCCWWTHEHLISRFRTEAAW